MLLSRRGLLIKCSCVLMSFLFILSQSTMPAVFAATPLTQMASDKKWADPEYNPQAPAMSPDTSTTPPEEAYIEGFGPEDLGTAPDVSTLEAGGISANDEVAAEIAPEATPLPVAVVPAPAPSPLVQQTVMEAGGIAVDPAGQNSPEEELPSDSITSSADSALISPELTSEETVPPAAPDQGAAAVAGEGTATENIPETYHKWATSTVTWGIDYESFAQNLQTYDPITDRERDDGVWSNAVAAFSEWAAYVPLTFQEAAADAAAIVIHALSPEAFNAIYPPSDGYSYYIAFAYYPWDQNPTGIGDTGDVFINGALTFGLSAAIAGEWSLLSTLVHELGHTIGVGHSDDEASIMYPTLDNAKTSLGVDDPAVVAAQSLYGVGQGNVVTNAVPTVDAISDKTLNEDAGTQTVNLTGITPGPNENQPVTITATSSNPALTGDIVVSYASPNTTGVLTFVPAANMSGTATITVTVNDGERQDNLTTRTFVVTVNSVNDVPTLDPVNDVAVDENSGEKTIPLSGITAGANENQPVTITATSSNPALTGNILVDFTPPNTNGALRFTPVANMAGTATITVEVNDGTAVTQKTFSLTVNPDTQAPVVTPVAPVTARKQAVHFTAVTGATGYEVQVSRNADFSDLIELQHPVVTSNQFVLPDFSSGTFYFRVRALEGAGDTKTPATAFSAAQPITMNVTYPLYMPPLSYAQGGVDVNILDWNPSTDGNVTGYKIYRRIFGANQWTLVKDVGMNIRYFDANIDTELAYQYEIRAYTSTAEIATPLETNRSANYDAAYQGLQAENVLVLINTKADGLGYTDLSNEVAGVWTPPGGVLDQNRTGREILVSLGYTFANGGWSNPQGSAVTGGIESILLSLGYKAIESLRIISEADLLAYLGLDASAWQDSDHDGIYTLPDWYVVKKADGTIEVPLGLYYAIRRDIPKENIVFVSNMPTAEREAFLETDFNAMIQMIHDAMVSRGIASKIASVVSAYHFPLVHGGHQWLFNGTVNDYSWEEAVNRGLWESFGGKKSELLSRINLGRGFSRQLGDLGFLTSRIDAADVSTARRMIDDGIWAEETYRFGRSGGSNPGLNAYVDYNGPYGDAGFLAAASYIGASGFFGEQGDHWDMAADVTAAWVAAHPQYDLDGDGRLDNTFLQTGWYHFNEGYQDLYNFARGAIAWELDSWSGGSYRGGQYWGNGVITHGAAATLGAVHEPGLLGHTHGNVFTYSLLRGLSFVEAGYYATSGGQMSFNADPLYAPFNASDSGDRTRIVSVLKDGVIVGYRYILSDSVPGSDVGSLISFREYDLDGHLVKEQLVNGTMIEYLPDGRTIFLSETPQKAFKQFGVYSSSGQLLHSALIPGRARDVADEQVVLLGDGTFEIRRHYTGSEREDVFNQNGALIQMNSQTRIQWTGTAEVDHEQILSAPGDPVVRVNREDGSYVLFTVNPDYPTTSPFPYMGGIEYRNSAGELLASLLREGNIYKADFLKSGFTLQHVTFEEGGMFVAKAVGFFEAFLSFGNSFTGDLRALGGFFVSQTPFSSTTEYSLGCLIQLVPGLQPPRISSISRMSDGARFNIVYDETGHILSATLSAADESLVVSIVKNPGSDSYRVQDSVTGLVLENVQAFSAESLFRLAEALPKVSKERVNYRESVINYLVTMGMNRDAVLAQISLNFSGIITSSMSLVSLYFFARNLGEGATEIYRGDLSYDWRGDVTLSNSFFTPDGTKIVFDSNHRIIGATLPNGTVQVYQYFSTIAASRLVKETYADTDTNANNNPSSEYYYTAQGVLQYRMHTDAQGARVYYDVNGQEIVRSVNGVTTFRVGASEAFFKKISDVLSLAKNGDIIEVGEGTYAEANLTIEINITIRGIGDPALTVIDGSTITGLRRFALVKKNVLFENLTIRNFSMAGNNGGAVYVTFDGTFRAKNCIFENNYSNAGGAIYAWKATVTLQDCVFRGNSGGHYWGSGAYPIGGGAITTNLSTLSVSGCRFLGNSGIVGGAIHVYEGSTAVIERSFFDGNRGGGAAAIEVGVGSTPSTATIDRCTFVNHTGNTKVVHVARGRTWVGNELQYTENGSTVNMTQSIIFGNSAEGLGADTTTTLNVQNCLLQAAWPGVGNIVGNPLFLDASHGDYRILRNSPAITSGTPAIAWGSAGFAAPQIVLPAGLEGTVTNQKDFTVTYTVDGQTKTQPFTLQEGLNDLHITEIDEFGQETTVGFKVTLDQVAPVVIVSTEPAMTFSEGSTVTTQSTVTVRYTVDGVLQPTIVVTLVVGDNEIVIPEQRDLAGNVTPAQTLHVTRRIPVIVVTSEIPAVTDQSTITVTYTVDGGATQSTTFMLGEGNNSGLALMVQDATWHTIATYTLPDIFRNAPPPDPVITVTSQIPMSTDQAQLVVTFTVDGGPEQSQTFMLTEGNNSGLILTGVDASGRVATYALPDIYRNAPASAIVVTSQVPTSTAQSSITVTFTVNGGAEQSQTFSLMEGNNSGLILTAVDASGNMVSYTLPDIYRTSPAPMIVVTSQVPASTDQDSITVTFTVDGGPEQSQTFMLMEGNNSGLMLTGVSATGNMVSYTLPDIYRTSPAPTIVVTSQVPTVTNQRILTVTFTVGGGAVQSQTFTLMPGDNNGLVLTATDGMGSVIATYALPNIRLDVTAPAVVVTTVPSLDFTNGAPLTRLSVLTVNYTVDGIAQTPLVITLTEGDNVITIPEQRDAAGNVTPARTLHVTRDTQAPAVVVTTVPSLDFTNGAPLTRLSVLTVNYSVDGIAQTPMVINLTEGDNVIVIPEQRDAAGNVTPARTLHVTRDTQAPAVVVSTIPSLDFTRGAPVTKLYSLTVNYTVDGIAQTPMVINLAEGDNVIVIPEQTDAAGNVTPARTLHVTRDTEAPEVVVTSDVPSTTDQAQIVVHYTVDGVAQTPLTFDLAAGVNMIRIPPVADAYGNWSEEQVYEVRREVAAAEIVVTSEIPDVTKESSLTVTYTLNGVEHTRTFQLTDGLNTLDLDAEDTLGRTVQKTFEITLDRVPPVIELAEELPSVIAVPAVYVSYTVDGESRMIVLPLVEGDNTDLKLTAMDAAGNETVFHLPTIRYEKPPVAQSSRNAASAAGGSLAEDNPAPAQSTPISVADFRVYYSSLNLSALQRMRVSQSLSRISVGAFVYRYETASGPSFAWTESSGRTRIFSFEDNVLLFGDILAPVL